MPRSRYAVGFLLFVSGMCSLIYETVWVRELRLVFGASTGASAAVIACFMGGLGAGALLLGSRADAHAGNLRWYATLEGVIAASAAITPFLLGAVRFVYIAVGGSHALGGGWATVLRLVLSAIVFAAPTIAMGGTLPAAVRAVHRSAEPARRSVALLYGMNALGAVAGCLVSTFVLFEAWGTRTTLWVACAVNLALAVIAFWISPALAHAGDDDAKSRGAGGAETVRLVLPPPRSVVLVAAAVSGFVFCFMELVWYRMLAPLLGGSVYTFGLILAVALAGIGIGGLAYAVVAERRRIALLGFAWTCLLQALAIAIPRALGDRIALAAAIVRPIGALGFSAQAIEWGVIACLVVLPAAIASGAQFPLLIDLLDRRQPNAGSDVGHLYAFNTGGAIIGSLAGGFGLVPAFGAVACWRLVAEMLLALGGAALIIDVRARRLRWSALGPSIVAGMTVAALATPGPSAAWRHSPIGAGLVDPDRLRTPNDVRAWVFERRRAVDWDADGRESSIGIDSENGVSFVVNGKNDGNARGDAATTVMLGLLGAFVHPNPRRAMVVGLGTGASAGWLAAVPSMTDVDVGELEPAVLEVARRSAPINQDVLSNPKVHVHLGDAREMLLTSKAKYDLIASEPSNPYRAGVASLFTREFYQAAANALEDDGMLLQWVQAYEVDAETVRTIYATVASVFPVVETWHLKSDDLLLIASARPRQLDVSRLRSRLEGEPFRSAFARAWRTTELEGVLAHYVAGPGTAAAIADGEGGAINTDDRNRVEFGFARSLGGNTDFTVNDVRAMARSRNDGTPRTRGGDVDWRRADEHVITLLADEGLVISRPDAGQGAAIAHRIAALNAFSKADSARVLAEWRAQSEEPAGPTELAVVATALADAGNEAASGYIDAMRGFDAAEADVTLARLRFRQGRSEDAMRSLEAGFAAYRADPWPLPTVMLRALSVSVELIARNPALATRMWTALRTPFCMRLADEVRKKVAAFAAHLMAPGPACVEANEALEPNPVWTEEFLTSRAACYEQTAHPLAPRARNDIREFLRLAPTRFSLPPG